MRIAFATFEYVTEDNYDGGLANYLHRVALALKDLGHTPVIVILSDRGDDQIFYHKGIQIHRVKFRRSRFLSRLDSLTRGRFTHFLYFLRASWLINNELRRIHEENSLSIIQYSQLGGVGLFMSKSIPSIIRISSFTPLAGKYGGYSGVNPKHLRMQALIEKWAMKRAKQIFGPCRQVATAVEEDVGKPVEIIESPFILDINTEDESLYSEKLKGKRFFLYFGTLNELKGVATIAEALPILLEKYPDIYFVFAGKESIYRGELMMTYIRRKSGKHIDRVIHLGKLKHEQLYPIIRQALAVVLPSFFDNFPNTCMEAMWHKKVIIGTEGTSFEQLLKDGASGFLCRAGDPGNLLSKMEAALDLSDEGRAEIGELAYRRVLELQPQKVVNELVLLYEKTITAQAGGK